MRKAVRAIIIRDKHLLVMFRNKFGQKYYTLVGGGIDPGETPEQALAREVREEAGLNISNPQLVYIEDAGKPFGIQYVFVCDADGAEVALHPHSEEAKINTLGQNLYTPGWLPFDKLAQAPFLSIELQEHLLHDLENGFPEKEILFSSNAAYKNQPSPGGKRGDKKT